MIKTFLPPAFNQIFLNVFIQRIRENIYRRTEGKIVNKSLQEWWNWKHAEMIPSQGQY